MKVREWICEGLQVNGKDKRILTSPQASREVAWRKLCFILPAEYRCFVRLVKGGIVER